MQYDRWAEGYDRRWRRYTARTHAALLAHADLSGAMNVLEVGCGTGDLIRRLGARWPHLHILGVEPSIGMRHVAMATLAPLVKAGGHMVLAAGDAAALPVPDGSMDAVAFASVLHYFPDPLAALAEARRVLRPGGQLLVVDYVPRGLPLTLADALIRAYDRGHQHTRSCACAGRLVHPSSFLLA